MNTNLDSHEKRIARVCAYVLEHLDDDLTVEELAKIAIFSKFHFHRLFSAHVGMGVSKFVLLMRLKRASFQLAFEQHLKIIEIALSAGFDSPEAFSRAFKRAFGQTPSAFRSAPDWPAWHAQFQITVPRSPSQMDVKITNFPETPVAVLSHKGAPERVLETAAQFIAWRKETGASPIKTSMTFGIPYGDPKTQAADDFRFDICGSVSSDVPQNTYGVQNGTIPGGQYAVVRHRGSHDTIDDSVYYLYREWLPESGRAPRGDFPCFFHYLNFVHDVDECDLLTDVYLPLE